MMSETRDLLTELVKAEAVIKICSKLLQNDDTEKSEVAFLLENLATQIKLETEKIWENQENGEIK